MPKNDTTTQEASINDQTSTVDEMIETIASENREDTEESIRDEGRDESAVIIDRLTSVINDAIESINERLSAIERAQRDTFASMVINGGVVTDTNVAEVDNASAAYSPNTSDYDLSID